MRETDSIETHRDYRERVTWTSTCSGWEADCSTKAMINIKKCTELFLCIVELSNPYSRIHSFFFLFLHSHARVHSFSLFSLPFPSLLPDSFAPQDDQLGSDCGQTHMARYDHLRPSWDQGRVLLPSATAYSLTHSSHVVRHPH